MSGKASRAFDPKKLRTEIEELVVNQGPLAGAQFKILPWQTQMLEAVADYREVALSISRANGKSTLVAALCCSAITPGKSMFVPRGQIILAAASMQQARIAFEHIQYFMRPTMYVEHEEGDWKLKRDEWREISNSHQMEIQHRPTGTTLKVIGSDPKRAHGLAPHLVVADEPAQFESGGDLFYAALRTALGKQSNPRMLIIGTRSSNPLHFFSRLLTHPPPGTKSIVYAATPKDIEDGGAYRIATIKKANPSYNHLEALREEIKSFRDDARKQGGMRRAQYLALYLNMGVSETDAQEDVVDLEDWRVLTKHQLPARAGPLGIGIDLGGGNSLSAVSFYWPDTGRLESYTAVPKYPSLEERGVRDGIGAGYMEMQEDGVLFIYGEKETRNAAFLADMFAGVQEFKWLGVACDRYKKTAVQQALLEAGFKDDIIVDRAVGRGKDGWDDLNAFRTACLEEHLRPGINLALEHAISSARITRDRNGNYAMDKSHQRGRIDALQSAVHAIGLGERYRKPPEGPGPGAFWAQALAQRLPVIGAV